MFGDLSQNIYLRPDDFVYMPSAKAQDVYVLGAVRNSKTVSYMNKLTLSQAIANAGGTEKDAHVSQVAIVRGSLAKPQMAVIDYKAVIHGEAPDILLEPQDIVYVPYTPYRTITRYANLVLDSFARSIGANEGSRAFNGKTASVSVNVNVPGGTTR